MKEDVPKRKVNTRGVLKVDGYTDFNPDINVRLSKSRASTRKDKKEKKCCK